MQRTLITGCVVVVCATIGVRSAYRTHDVEEERVVPTVSSSCVCPAYKMFVPMAAGMSYWYCTRADCIKDESGNCTNQFACIGSPVGDYLPDGTKAGTCRHDCSDPNCRILGGVQAPTDPAPPEPPEAPPVPEVRRATVNGPRANPSGKLHTIPATAELTDFGFEYDKPNKNPHIKKVTKRTLSNGQPDGVLMVQAFEDNEDGSTTVIDIPLHLVVWKFKFDDERKEYHGLGTEVVSPPDGVPQISNLIKIEPMTTSDDVVIEGLYIVYAKLKNNQKTDTFVVRTSHRLKL